jgi:hypothetical protein
MTIQKKIMKMTELHKRNCKRLVRQKSITLIRKEVHPQFIMSCNPQRWQKKPILWEREGNKKSCTSGLGIFCVCRSSSWKVFSRGCTIANVHLPPTQTQPPLPTPPAHSTPPPTNSTLPPQTSTPVRLHEHVFVHQQLHPLILVPCGKRIRTKRVFWTNFWFTHQLGFAQTLLFHVFQTPSRKHLFLQQRRPQK